jgi:acetyl esterase/lipase
LKQNEVIMIRISVLMLAAAATVADGSLAMAQSDSHAVVKIWLGVAPGAENWKQKEVEELTPGPGEAKNQGFRNVVTPTLSVYEPPAGKANGTAVIVCPGGGYYGLSFTNEGTSVAEWLASRGVTAFVLKYRLIPTSDDVAARTEELKTMLTALQADFDANVHKLDAGRTVAVADGRQAIRYVREHAAQWHVAPDRIGIIGFSAGAGLTMALILDHDEASRPNFAAPIYGYMDDKALPKDAPPLFIVATQADSLVPSERSVRIYQKWTAAKLPAELHLFEQGPHGFGFRALGLPVDHWPELFENWLRSRSLLTASHQ